MLPLPLAARRFLVKLSRWPRLADLTPMPSYHPQRPRAATTVPRRRQRVAATLVGKETCRRLCGGCGLPPHPSGTAALMATPSLMPSRCAAERFVLLNFSTAMASSSADSAPRGCRGVAEETALLAASGGEQLRPTTVTRRAGHQMLPAHHRQHPYLNSRRRSLSASAAPPAGTEGTCG